MLEGLTARHDELRARLRPFVARRVPAADVEDVVQDVFVRLHRHRDQLRARDRYDAWMWSVARSAVEDRHRQRRRHPLREAEPDESAEQAVPPVDAVLEAASAARLEETLASLVGPFVEMLPSPYREALTLVELEGLTQAEAARRLEVPLPTMKARVQRGRVKLRALFEACCEIALDARGRVVGCEPRAACDCAVPSSAAS